MTEQANKAQLLAYYKECFQADQSIRIKLHGNCMWPVVRAGDLLTIEEAPHETLRFGDVAIFKTSDQTLHANIQFISNAKIRASKTLQQNYFGRVTQILRNGKAIDLRMKPLFWRWVDAFLAPANPYLLSLPKTILGKFRGKRQFAEI